MKRILIRPLFLLFAINFFSIFTLHAQNLTGIWKGYFISDEGEQYKLEFQISQSNSYAITGVSYSYLDVRFYGKATMTGSFIKTSSSFRIREIKTVEVKSILGGATCIMNYNFVYSKSGKEEFLDGTYLGKYERKGKPVVPGTWGDCGGGKVYLRKVNTSDFYVEPFLRNKIKQNSPTYFNEAPHKKDSLKTTNPLKKTVNTVSNKPPVKKPVTNNATVNKKSVAVKPNNNTAATNKKSVATNTNETKANSIPKDSTLKTVPALSKVTPPKQMVPTPNVLKTRTNELVKVLVVNDPNVTVKLYDNGEIDDDTISVYLDRKLVLSAKRLSAAPLTVKIKMDEDDSEHELVMVAENLGRIPPNTSLMIVESGDQRFDVRITSTEQKNALVRFKYQKPD
jgi:hypothetical protein